MSTVAQLTGGRSARLVFGSPSSANLADLVTTVCGTGPVLARAWVPGFRGMIDTYCAEGESESALAWAVEGCEWEAWKGIDPVWLSVVPADGRPGGAVLCRWTRGREVWKLDCGPVLSERD